MAEIDDLFSDPNAGAYEAKETRVGPPLAYVGEKLKSSLEHAHRAARASRESAAEEMGRDADTAFRYGVTAFLGLYNMLGMLVDHRKLDALLELDGASFEQWLDTVEREGSVHG
ncbi:MAG: hypothetical protein RRA92_11250 [Gemmatimonadota bacterium]|nr:hypothetical protein [Gemmatimonadota bacterium]